MHVLTNCEHFAVRQAVCGDVSELRLQNLLGYLGSAGQIRSWEPQLSGQYQGPPGLTLTKQEISRFQGRPLVISSGFEHSAGARALLNT